MKKLKKVFGVFAAALLLMSMSSNSAVVKADDCWEHASFSADFHYNNGTMTYDQSADYFEAIYTGCINSGFN